MRLAHRCASPRAVADDDYSSYRGVMKTNYFIHHRADTASTPDEPRPHVRTDAHAITRKALERWENEGGKIPELYAWSHRKASARTERF